MGDGVTDPRDEEVRRRQRSRALVIGLLLAGFAVLIYAITIAKMGLRS
jgi:hypothetical protein